MKRVNQRKSTGEKSPLLKNDEDEKKKGTMKHQPSFDWAFVKRFSSIIRTLYTKSLSTVAVTAILVGVVVVNVVVTSYTGDVTGGFSQAIVDRDRSAFFKVMILSAFIVMSSAILDSTIKFITELLAWYWRRTLCLHLHEKYFVNTLYYKLVSLDHRVDNPDQRITQDVDKFSTTLADVLSKCMTAPLTIALYTYRTWITIDWFAPLIIMGYFFVGYALNKLIMSPIARLVFQQEKLEGDFRFDHIRVRTCAESIAIYDGGLREKESSEETFKELLKNKLRLLRWHWTLNSSSNVFSYGGSILNYFIVAIPVIFIPHHNIDPSPLFVGKAIFECIMLVSGFSQFISVSQSVSDIAGFTARIAHMVETLDELKENKKYDVEVVTPRSVKKNVPAEEGKEDETVRFENVTCYTPNGVRLVNKLTFIMKKGNNVLITGPSGSGKTSILKVLNGLWPFYEGTVTKPSNFNEYQLFYLPQKPYLFNGTLRDQIIYPIVSASSNILSNERLIELLQTVGLNYVIETYSLDERVNWIDTLSPGQQQLLSFARLLFHQPTFAILDESTSSLPEETEEYLYRLCGEKNITLLSVGHRRTLRPFHDYLLTLDHSDEWQMSKINAKKERLDIQDNSDNEETR